MDASERGEARRKVLRRALWLRLSRVALRYEQKTAAILQVIVLLLRVQTEAIPDSEISKAVSKFRTYLEPNKLDLESYFAGMLLVSAITEAEAYFVDVVRAVIAAFPKKVGTVSFKLSDVLDASPDELVRSAAEDYLNRLMYKKPADYLGDLSSMLSIDKAALEADWPQFVEGKARRDLGIHNSWMANDVYRRKVRELGLDEPPEVGASLAPNYAYVGGMVQTCDRIISGIHQQLEKIHNY